MIHSDVVHETIIYMDVISNDLHVVVRKQFTNKLKFDIREHMFQ